MGKSLIAPGSAWGLRVMPVGFQPVELRDIVGVQGGWKEGLLHWVDEAYDPGTKSRRRIVEKASYKYLNESGEPQYERVRDIARIAFKFDSAARLLAALDEAMS